MFLYHSIIFIAATIPALAIGIPLHDRLRNHDNSLISDNPLVQIIVPTIVIGAILFPLLSFLPSRFPSPNLYQISSNSKVYLVSYYDDLLGVRFQCNSASIRLADAEIKEVSRTPELEKSANYCKD
jgi:hypothetical protein